MKRILTILLLFVAVCSMGQVDLNGRIAPRMIYPIDTLSTSINDANWQTYIYNATKTLYELVNPDAPQALTETAGAASMNYVNGKNAKITIYNTTTLTMSNIPDGKTGNILVIQGDGDDDNFLFVYTGLTVKWRDSDTDLTNTIGAEDIISYWRAGSFLYVTLGSNYITQ